MPTDTRTHGRGRQSTAEGVLRPAGQEVLAGAELLFSLSWVGQCRLEALSSVWNQASSPRTHHGPTRKDLQSVREREGLGPFPDSVLCETARCDCVRRDCVCLGRCACTALCDRLGVGRAECVAGILEATSINMSERMCVSVCEWRCERVFQCNRVAAGLELTGLLEVTILS